MRITYRAKVNSYVCNNKGRQIAYSVNQYGELAILLAEQSITDMIKRKNYIIEEVSIENNSVKAYWMENGRLKSKRFSFSRYSNALELAINYRKNKEIECGYVV